MTYEDGTAQIHDARTGAADLPEALHTMRLIEEAERASPPPAAPDLTYAPLDPEEAANLPPWDHWRVFAPDQEDPETEELPPIDEDEAA